MTQPETLIRLLAQLDRYSCGCGSGAAMACDDDCLGENADHDVRAVLRVLVPLVIRLVNQLEETHGQPKP